MAHKRYFDMINKYGTCVLKIGGSQYPDVNAVYKIGEVVQSLSEQYQIKAIVVSAMGKTTSELDATAHSITKKQPNKCALDGYLATGEIQSAALLAMHLDDIGIPAHYYDAKSFGILTDENFGKATIQKITMPYVCPLNGIPVVAGFQGVTKYGDFTTLGREGSDITAVWVATVLAAGCCWFFKNGGGIYDKAPNGGSDAKLFREISYTWWYI